ncbi:hypothetical protein Tco_0082757, partial [Tanacetum coccineum]
MGVKVATGRQALQAKVPRAEFYLYSDDVYWTAKPDKGYALDISKTHIAPSLLGLVQDHHRILPPGRPHLTIQ